MTSFEVSLVAYVDDTVLLGLAADIAQAISEIQAETATAGLKLQKAKTQVWSPTQTSIDNEPLLRTLQGRMGDRRSVLILGETVSEDQRMPYRQGMKDLLRIISITSSKSSLMTSAN